MRKMSRFRRYFLNYIFPAVLISSVTGALTGAVITLYKFCASHVIGFSEKGYHFMGENPYWLPVIVAALFAVAFFYSKCYQKYPNLQGGGIPTSVGILRGLISFDWLKNLIGTFSLSLLSFFIGVPLGNEGPSVQIGTAIGRAGAKLFGKKASAWSRYSMTGGACAGFSVATGAPISGVVFSVEEAHRRVSPLIVIVSSVSVVSAVAISNLLSPLLGVETSLFPEFELVSLSTKDMWIPIILGVLSGLFAVAFLKYYRVVSSFIKKKLKKVSHTARIFSVFALTVIAGLVSHEFVSTGHEVVLGLFEESTPVLWLVLILAVRSTLTLSANSSGVTGGLFVPMLAIGALFAAIAGRGIQSMFALDESYFVVMLLLGITACIAGMMKMPVTAVIFAVEALSCYKNVLPVIIVSATAYVITEIFKAESINDVVLENKVNNLNKGKIPQTVEEYVTVKDGSFAVGKHIRDILWPPSLFVLSMKHNGKPEEDAGEICGGDTLYVRYKTTDIKHTKEELDKIIG